MADVSTPTVVLAGGVFWSGFKGGFNAVSVFPVLSVVSIVVKPVVSLLNALPGFTGAVACFSRIQSFLLLPEYEDRRIIGGGSPSSRHDTGLMAHDWPDDCAIALQNATIKYHDSGREVLKEVCFQISRGHLAFVVGPVASGKFAVLKAILGEVNFSTGSLYVQNAHIAYCGQSPWLQNLTIQQSIIGCHAFDSTWYLTILRACCIDLTHFRNGDQTQIGSSGVNISGGQKQRIVSMRHAPKILHN